MAHNTEQTVSFFGPQRSSSFSAFPSALNSRLFRQCKYANSLLPIGKINRFLCPEGRKLGHSQTGTPFLNGADKCEGPEAFSQTEQYGSVHLHPGQRSLGCIKKSSIARNCPPGGKAALSVGPLAAWLWPLKSLAALFAPEFPAQPSIVFIIPLAKAPQDVFLFLETAASIYITIIWSVSLFMSYQQDWVSTEHPIYRHEVFLYLK